MKKRAEPGATKLDVLMAIVVGVLLLMLDFGRPWIAAAALMFTLLAFMALRTRWGGRNQWS